MKKQVFTTGLVLLMLCQVTAQITITRNDMPDPWDIILYRMAPNAGGVDYTLTGNNFTWDFSGLGTLAITVDSYVPVSSTPLVYQAVFNVPLFNPPATIAQDKGGIEILPGISFDEYYDFFKETNASFSFVGFGVTVNNIPIPVKYNTPEILYKFPLTMGSADSGTTSKSLSVADFGYYETQRKRVNKVDGWGVLTTPHGTFQTIRMKSTLYAYDSVYIDSISTGYAVNRVETEYKWMGNGFGGPLLRIVESNLFPLRVEYISDESELLTVDAGPDQTISFGESATLIATTTGGVPPYLFVWSNGSVGDTIVVNPTQTTTYIVNVNDFNLSGAQDQVTVFVENGLFQQLIPLQAGWNGISLNVFPQYLPVTEVLTPIQDKLIIIQNFEGMYYPANSINTLGNWDISSGYFIKMEEPAILQVDGFELQNRNLELTAGWNIIPFLGNCTLEVNTIAGQIQDELEIIIPVAGYQVYWPEMAVHSLTWLIPGNAYLFRVTANCEIVFPVCDK